MRRVLIIAYKFPDLVVPGGSVRLEKLLSYLPGRWKPIVVSVDVPPEAMREAVHSSADVHRTRSHYRAFVRAYSTVHLEDSGVARRGLVNLLRRFKNLFLVPDDAVLWWPAAWSCVRRICRDTSIDAVFCSGPPFSNLLLGALVARRYGVPFVADFRDDWAGNPLAGPRNIAQRIAEFRLERFVFHSCARAIHVTEASLELHSHRYPFAAKRMELIRNGYDEADFDGPPAPRENDRFEIVHTGSLKDDRSPVPVLRAMAKLRERDAVYGRLHFRQVGPTRRALIETVHGLGLAPQVTWAGPLDRSEAISIVRAADALLLLPTVDIEGHTAIPGKAYEYLRAMRPVLVISKPNETTRFLGGFPGVRLCQPDDIEAIAQVLEQWSRACEGVQRELSQLRDFSRESQARELARVLDEVVAEWNSAGE